MKVQFESEPIEPFGAYPFESGVSRREFLRQTGAAALLVHLLGCKPSFGSRAPETLSGEHLDQRVHFSESEEKVLLAAHMILFPDDGDGPSARDLHSVSYLRWALTDPDNRADGDEEFILKGVRALDQHSLENAGRPFVELTADEQRNVFGTFTELKRGRNWASINIYYITEALLLDPLYGGNPDQIGWKWLKHKPGFPRPPAQKSYRVFS